MIVINFVHPSRQDETKAFLLVLGRVGIDYEPQSQAEIERDLEIRQMQVGEARQLST